MANMESHPNDDWIDKVMLFLANWSRPIAEEWFKLAQWLLVLTAFAFLYDRTKNIIYAAILAVSFITLFLYSLVGYQELWHKRFHERLKKDENDLRDVLRNTLVWGVGSLLAVTIAGGILCLALLLGREGAVVLYGK